jgi:hypothetical protein
MTDELIEAMAKAIYEGVYTELPKPWSLLHSRWRAEWIRGARAALQAIEASGTHVVVPVKVKP